VTGTWRKTGHPQVSQASQSHRTCPGCHPEQWKRTAIEAVRKGWVRQRLFKQGCSNQRRVLSGTCSSSIRINRNPPIPLTPSQLPKLVPAFSAVVAIFWVSLKKTPFPNSICIDVYQKKHTPPMDV